MTWLPSNESVIDYVQFYTSGQTQYQYGYYFSYFWRTQNKNKYQLSLLRNLCAPRWWCLVMHASEKMSFINWDGLSPICRKSVPSGQRFLSDMALSIYEVVRVTCQSGVVGLFTPREKLCDWQTMQTTSLMLTAMLARKKPLLIRGKRLSSENLAC